MCVVQNERESSCLNVRFEEKTGDPQSFDPHRGAPRQQCDFSCAAPPQLTLNLMPTHDGSSS